MGRSRNGREDCSTAHGPNRCQFSFSFLGVRTHRNRQGLSRSPSPSRLFSSSNEPACYDGVMLLPLLLSLTLPQTPPTGLYGADPRCPQSTALTLEDGREYGARSDHRGPIGGGAGFADILREGHITANTLDELIDGLARAQPGQVVFLPGDCVIDCTAAVLIEQLQLKLPAGVTLASDRGHEGSKGALLFCDHLKTQPLMTTTGEGATLSGLRIRGPDPERRLDHHRRAYRMGEASRGRDYYYALPTSDGIRAMHDRLRVTNCELAGWSHAAIDLRKGVDHQVHHCFIHHNQRQGLGYGICLDQATATIENNLFDWNRHSIAGTGRPGCSYTARHNVERGVSLSHCFDMHGGRDRKDGTNIAGTTLVFERNTFLCDQLAIKIRGIPEDSAQIQGNWFRNSAWRSQLPQAPTLDIGRNAIGPREDPRITPGPGSIENNRSPER